MPLLDLKDLRSYLEECFKNQVEEISFYNKKYKDDRSFLTKTYCVEWPFERGNSVIRITVFRDMPSPYPEKILGYIRTYMKEKGIPADFKFWISYQDLKSLDPVRKLRN